MDGSDRGRREPLSLTNWIEGLGRDVSLLMAHGHLEARHYPVPMVWRETRIVRQRIEREMANTALLMQLTIGSVLSEDAGKEFKKQVRRLLGN